MALFLFDKRVQKPKNPLYAKVSFVHYGGGSFTAAGIL